MLNGDVDKIFVDLAMGDTGKEIDHLNQKTTEVVIIVNMMRRFRERCVQSDDKDLCLSFGKVMTFRRVCQSLMYTGILVIGIFLTLI